MSNEICCPQCGGYGETLDPPIDGTFCGYLKSCSACSGTGIKITYCDDEIKKILVSDKVRIQKKHINNQTKFNKALHAAIDAIKDVYKRS